MTPQEYFESGQLTAAITASIDLVKRHPTKTEARELLCQLLCFGGDLERADKQLDTIGHQRAEAVLGVALIRQLIRGEVSRRECFSDGRIPELLGEPPAHIQKHLQAVACLREDQIQEAADLLAEAEDARPKCSGQCDEKAFDDFRDLDDVTASFMEVITSNGKYFWIPTERVRLIEFHKPEKPLDLVWRRAHMIVSDGPDGEVFIPTTYVDTYREDSDALKLARGTEWRGEDGMPIRGVGQRMILIGEEDRPILQLGTIEFDDVG